MAQISKIDPCDRLEDTIHGINKQLGKLAESDAALLLMDPGMVKLLLQSIKEIRIIEAQHTEPFCFALRLYNLKIEYSKTRSRFWRTIKKIVEQYTRNSYKGPLFPKEDFDYIADHLFDPDEKYYFKEAMVDELRTISRNSSEAIKTMGEGLSQLSYFYDGILMVGECILERLIREGKELREQTVCSIREYCRTSYKPKLLRDLRHEAVRLMGDNKYSHVSQENWKDLLKNEDKIIELGKNGQAFEEYKRSKAEDARFEFYGEDRCKILDDDTGLMDIMLKVNHGLELFDLEGAIVTYDLLSALNESNLELFCEMFLRRNVMLGMIEPELKNEFEKWLNTKPAQPEDTYHIENLTEEARGWLLRKDIYPKLAKLLNDEVKPYVEGTGTKATWDSIHFLFKHYGIVGKRFSREKFAKLVTQIVPDLGEASALEHMMEKSDVNWPSPSGFDIDKSKSSVAIALSPFYDKFKNL